MLCAFICFLVLISGTNSLECKNGYVMSSDLTRCLPVATGGIGDNCLDTAQCSQWMREGGVCDNGICKCAKLYHYFRGRCLKDVGKNGECTPEIEGQCYSAYDSQSMDCVANNKRNSCQCKEGFYSRGYTDCRREAVGNENCTITPDCHQDPQLKCDFQQHTCVPATPLQIEDEDVANPVQAHPKTFNTLSCEDSNGCAAIPNSLCIYNKCFCKPGFFQTADNTCSLELGMECKEGSNDCQHIKDASCILTGKKWVCSCVAGYGAGQSNRECVRVAMKSKFQCTEDSVCSTLGSAAHCLQSSPTKKICGCDEGYYYNAEQVYCWVSKKIGETCLDELDCRTEGSDAKATKCSNNVCSCSPEFHPTTNKTSCLPDRHIGEQCDDTEDCFFPNAECASNKCKCAPGYYATQSPLNNPCVLGINGACANDSECTVEHSICDSSVCSCASGFFSNQEGSDCIAYVNKIGGNCSLDKQCQGKFGEGGRCYKQKCDCDCNYHFNNGTCLVKKYLGMQCNSQFECYSDENVERIDCKNNLCTCKPEYEREDYRCISRGVHVYSSALWIILMLTCNILLN